MLAIPYLARLIQVVLDGTPFPHVDRAVPLLLGVAAQESGLVYTRQLGGGPARGYFQCEPATERDLWRWIEHNPAIERVFAERAGVEDSSVLALEHNLPYQILLARLHFYLRDPQALPAADNLQEHAVRWKQFYNTPHGGGTVEQYLTTWQRVIASQWSGKGREPTRAPDGAGVRPHCGRSAAE